MKKISKNIEINVLKFTLFYFQQVSQEKNVIRIAVVEKIALNKKKERNLGNFPSFEFHEMI